MYVGLLEKLLEEGETLTLTRTFGIADQYKKVETQMATLSTQESMNANDIKSKRKMAFEPKKTGEMLKGDCCYR